VRKILVPVDHTERLYHCVELRRRVRGCRWQESNGGYSVSLKAKLAATHRPCPGDSVQRDGCGLVQPGGTLSNQDKSRRPFLWIRIFTVPGWVDLNGRPRKPQP